MLIRNLMSGLGGMAGLLAGYLIMNATGLWDIYLTGIHRETRIAIYLTAVLLLSGFCGGALVLFLGEKVRLFPSMDEVERRAKPVALFPPPAKPEPRRGEDKRIDLELTLEEAANGKRVQFFTRDNQRNLIVNVPGGVQHGYRLRLVGEGEPGDPAGDLYIYLAVTASSGPPDAEVS